MSFKTLIDKKEITDLSPYVPYTAATGNVNLGTYNLTATDTQLTGNLDVDGYFVLDGGQTAFDDFYGGVINTNVIFQGGNYLDNIGGGSYYIDDYATWANYVYVIPTQIGMIGTQPWFFQATDDQNSNIFSIRTTTTNTQITKETLGVLATSVSAGAITNSWGHASGGSYSDDIFIGDVAFNRDITLGGNIDTATGSGDLYYNQKDFVEIGGTTYGHIFTANNGLSQTTLLDLDISGADFQNLTITTTNSISGANGTFTNDVVVKNDLTVDTNTLFVDASENKVGIGTTTPTEKLDVDGNAKATEFHLGTNATITFNSVDNSIDFTIL